MRARKGTRQARAAPSSQRGLTRLSDLHQSARSESAPIGAARPEAARKRAQLARDLPAPRSREARALARAERRRGAPLPKSDVSPSRLASHPFEAAAPSRMADLRAPFDPFSGRRPDRPARAFQRRTKYDAGTYLHLYFEPQNKDGGKFQRRTLCDAVGARPSALHGDRMGAMLRRGPLAGRANARA